MRVSVIKASINSAGKSNASARVSAGDVDKTSDWSFSADDGNKLLGADSDDWANYAKWFLGEDSSADEKTKGRYKYPFGKNGKVYRSALVAIRQRASQQDDTTIYNFAGELLDKIDGKSALPSGIKSPPIKQRAYATLSISKFLIGGKEMDPYDPDEDDDIDDPDREDDDELYDMSCSIEGIASTPAPDRMGDIVEPDGVMMNLPLPFLWQHDAEQPIGQVVSAKPKSDGIPVKMEIPNIPVKGALRDRLTEAVHSMKYGLVKGLSIGFSPVEYNYMQDTGGFRFVKWNWYELSAVTIPANMEAGIDVIKRFDRSPAGVLVPKRKSIKLSSRTMVQVPKGYGPGTGRNLIQPLVDKHVAASESAHDEIAAERERMFK